MLNRKTEPLAGNDFFFQKSFVTCGESSKKTENPNSVPSGNDGLNSIMVDMWPPYNMKDEYYLKLNVIV